MCQDIRKNIRAFVLGAAEAFALRGPVYQFGSCLDRTADETDPLDDCFPRTDYVVCRFDDGVALGSLPFPDGSAQTVLWLGSLGRAFDTQPAVLELGRILAPGGALLIYTPGDGRAYGQTPNASQAAVCGVQRLLAPLQLTLLGWQGAEGLPHTVCGLGFKRPITRAIVRGTDRFLERSQQQLEPAGGKIGWRRRMIGLLGKGVRTILPRPWWAVPPKTRRENSSDPSSARRADCRMQFAVHVSAGRALDDDLWKAWLFDEKTGGRLDLME
jgi:SAM-dependent methyltransferase